MPTTPMIGLPAVKALTLRQPWAWATIYGGKDVENRRWKTRHRGPLLIHAGMEIDTDGSASVLKALADPFVFASHKLPGRRVGQSSAWCFLPTS